MLSKSVIEQIGVSKKPLTMKTKPMVEDNGRVIKCVLKVSLLTLLLLSMINSKLKVARLFTILQIAYLAMMTQVLLASSIDVRIEME